MPTTTRRHAQPWAVQQRDDHGGWTTYTAPGCDEPLASDAYGALPGEDATPVELAAQVLSCYAPTTGAFRVLVWATPDTAQAPAAIATWTSDDAPDARAYEPPPTPTDDHGIAAMLREDTDGQKDHLGRDLHDRLAARLGADEAAKLWSSACRLADHDDAADNAITGLAEALKDALAGLRAAQANLRALTGGDAWHSDYAEGAPGTDMARFLDDAARALRAATAINPIHPD